MADEERCKHEMLPGQCADCRGLVEEVPDPFEGLLIEQFYFSAQHTQTCAMSRRGLQDHDIVQGQPFARAVREARPQHAAPQRIGYVCDECTNRIAR